MTDAIYDSLSDRWSSSLPYPGHRVIAERFVQIQQAVAVRSSVLPEGVAFVADVVERRKADGSVAAWLQHSGQADGAVAPAR